VNAEVRLRISPDIALVAIVTSESVTELGLAPGRAAIAMVNASSIILTDADANLRTSARNSLTGVVTRHEKGAVNDEITLELAPGKTLVATITQQSAEDLGLQPGSTATALIKASHVILAVD
jgi:molybdate transport system regulatory protein